MPASRVLAALVLLSASVFACVSVDSTSSPSTSGGNDNGVLSPACQLLAPCCDRWPDDLRRSCSGPAEVKGPEGESACKTFLSNGVATAYCPELDILNCSDELRAVMGDKCGGDGGTGPGVAVGLETFSASNLGTIEVPPDLVDVTIGSDSATALCSVTTATGQSSCLTGANKLVAKRIGDFDVLFAKSVVVGAQAFVTLEGTRPVIVVGTDRIEVKGMLSVGYLTTNLLDDKPRPGVQTSGAGVGTSYGGGGFCGNGGDSFDGNGGAGGGKTYGAAALVPLVGGSAGADANSKASGAMQLVAGAKIVIDGLLNAHGQDGFRASGGSGGAVLVEAPSISGAGQISADGGKGDGNVNTTTGGGPGSTATTMDGQKATVAYAYGGGGAGRIRLNARAQTFAGSMSPAKDSACTSSGTLRAR